jgi:hypothetical protein
MYGEHGEKYDATAPFENILKPIRIGSADTVCSRMSVLVHMSLSQTEP